MNNQTNQPQIDQVQFLRQLAAHFNTGEMITLCFTLGIKYDDLRGETRTDKARELIEYAERHGRLRELLERAMAERPNVDWPKVITGKRQALIIWYTKYTDKRLNDLPFSNADGWSLKRVISHPEIGQFDDTTCLINPSRQEVQRDVQTLFGNSFPPDVLLLYVIGHGLVEKSGDFYLVVADTDLDRLQETAVSAQFITSEMDGCLSSQKILVLDCSYGSLAPTKGVAEESVVGVNQIFKGNEHGRIILAARNKFQYIWQEYAFVGAKATSDFTRLLVNGLTNGGADLDQDDTGQSRELLT